MPVVPYRAAGLLLKGSGRAAFTAIEYIEGEPSKDYLEAMSGSARVLVRPTIFSYWRKSLSHLYDRFRDVRTRTRYFYAKAFLVFALLNLACFWWALLTAYSTLLLGEKAHEYILIGFPVAFFGAVFDSLSLLVTLFIVRRALASDSNLNFFGYLSVDLVIAVLATFWVLFIFIVSGWLVDLVLAQPETLAARRHLYQGRLLGALTDPFALENLRNIYFGMIMGASALIPTLLHIALACGSMLRSGANLLGFVRDGSV
jgi:hypothetical protein